MEYNFREIEKKWHDYWIAEKVYKVEKDTNKPKYYVLDMFPYPSGAGLHVGHPLGYIASDIYSRFKRLQGFNVLHPMGYDAYGLPAEQYAIQTGQHPEITTKNNIARYREQLEKIGFCYDWSREIRTCDPEYYKWTQWAFIRMFNSYYCNDEKQARPISELIQAFETSGTEGLNVACGEELSFTAEEWKAKSDKEKQEILLNYRIAYRGETMVNWCAALGTVLANDEVVNGVSERGGYPVEQKIMRQWCLRVSAYAQRLLDGLDTIDWTDSLKETQKNWIGRSEGAEVRFKVKDSDKEFTIFTTRADTMFGVTFMVLAPESELVQQLTTADQKAEVDAYLDRTKKRTERERIADRQVTGVFSGSYAINPFTGEAVPIWISDYVLAGYGTGAIMAVPAHDDRDWEFAKKFGCEIIEVVSGGEDVQKAAYTDVEEGVLCNSGFLNGLTVAQAKKTIIDWLVEHKVGERKVNYKLRDWVFSRQRYWGEPIPLVNCEKCGWVAIPESELPLVLPQVESYEPTDDGESPLSKMTDWVNTTCPCCGGPAKRETDTMPQWAGSSWYFLRYMDPHNPDALASPEALNYWAPVDWYNGGMEHTTLHLLYSRFWHKFLYDIGVVPTKEPYQKRTSHGMILGQNGEKMSKSRGNVVNPDEIVDQYGADTMRLYEMFIGDFEKAAPWNSDSIKGCKRFLERYWNLQTMVTPEETYSNDLETLMHQTIQKVTEDIDQLKCNTAIAALMTLLNKVYDKGSITRGELRTLTVLLNPFAPHVTEEMWEVEQFGGMVHEAQWPAFDPAKTKEDTVEIVLQVLGKVRSRMTISADTPKEEVLAAAKADSKIAALLEGKTIKKEIYVPGKLVNFVAI